MAHIFADRLLDSTATTGAGALTLQAPSFNGYQNGRDVLANGDTVYLTVSHRLLPQWEIGKYTYGSGASSLTRTQVLASSNDGSAVNFSSGVKDVVGGLPASVIEDLVAIASDGTLLAGSVAAAAASALVAATEAAAAAASAAVAAAAADAIGPINFYDTKADANAALSGLSNLDVIEVFVDESRGNRRTRYRKESGVYVFKLYMGPPAIIDVMTYGAVGDGFTDDRVAIAAAAAVAGEVRANLFTRSQEFDDADWSKTASSITANNTAAPDGSTTADKLTTSGGGISDVNQTVTVANATAYTVSAYVKAGTASRVLFIWYDGSNHFAYFNLGAGAVGTVGAGTTATIEALANSWYRITASRTSADTSLILAVAPCDADGAPIVTAGRTCYLWGAQLELGSAATPYIVSGADSGTRAASGTLLFSAGKFRVSGDLTLSENVALQFEGDASIAVDSASTVTVNGPVLAGNGQIFTGDGFFVGSDVNGDVLAAWFGVDPDNEAAFNGVGLMRMGHYLRFTRGHKVVRFATAGAYVHDRTEWMKGINHLTVYGGNSTFQNRLVGDEFTYDVQRAAALSNFNPFNGRGYDVPYAITGDTIGSSIGRFGYLIDTVASRSVSVTTSTPADAANFTAGDRVLIYGWAQQANTSPPNARYFEWATVTSSDDMTGEVSIEKTNVLSDLGVSLAHDYDSRWWDFQADAAGLGAPRILNLDRDDEFNWCDYIELNDMEFLNYNDVDASGIVYIQGHTSAVMNNITAPLFSSSLCLRVQCNDCNFETAETDKMQDSVTFSGCRMAIHAAGTGVNFLAFDKGTIVTDRCECLARNTVIDGAILSGFSDTTPISLAAAFAVTSVDVRAARIVPAAQNTLSGIISAGQLVSFVVDSAPSNSKVLVETLTDDDAIILFQSFQRGATYTLKSGANRVRIANIYQEDATHVAIEGDFIAASSPGDVFWGSQVQSIRLGHLEVDGPITAARRLPAFSIPLAAKMYSENRDGRHFFKAYTDEDFFLRASGAGIVNHDETVRARLMSLRVHVDVPYTGGASNTTLVISGIASGETVYAVIDLETTGPRMVDTFGNDGSAGADTLTAATNDDYCDAIRINIISLGGLYPTYSDRTELPKFRVVAEFMQA